MLTREEQLNFNQKKSNQLRLINLKKAEYKAYLANDSILQKIYRDHYKFLKQEFKKEGMI